MSSQIVSVFTNYQKARTIFAQSVAELASRPQNIDFLLNAQTLKFLKPLLNDFVPAIQQTATMAVARLASYSPEVASQIVEDDIIDSIISFLQESEDYQPNETQKPGNARRHLRKAGAIVLRSVAKHSEDLALKIIQKNGVQALNSCLESFDAGVKEAASWALGYIASHSETSALSLVTTRSIELLVISIQEPEIAIKRVALSALGDVCKHSEATAKAVVEAGVPSVASKLVLHVDSKVRRQACGLLATIAKQSIDLAEVIIDCEILPDLITLLQDDDIVVCRNAADCLREVSKHSIELARLVIAQGGLAGIVDLISKDVEKARTSEQHALSKLPAIMCLGYMSSFSETLAATVVSAHGVEAIKEVLSPFQDSVNSKSSLMHKTNQCGQFMFLQSAAVWSIGRIGSHSSEHALACAKNDLLRLLCNVYVDDFSNSSVDVPVEVIEDLRNKAGESLELILEKCTHLPALQALLTQQEGKETKVTVSLLKIILRQIGKVLPHDRKGKKCFVQTSALQFVQELEQKLTAQEYKAIEDEVEVINNCYPSEIVDYYSPKHADELIKLLDDGEDESKEEENENKDNVEEKT